MSDSQGPSLRIPLGRILGLATHVVVWGVIGVLLGLAIFVWKGFAIVEKGKIAILIRKTGDPLPSGEIIARESQKGIQLDPLPEGWHWRNPYTWDWEIRDQVVIRQGEVGVQIRNHGKPMPPGRVLADDGEKGVLRDTLKPSSYRINPYAVTVKRVPAVTIEAGHTGVVVLVSGTEPKDPNVFLVQPGERGMQKEVRPPGTYYVNPYVEQIISIDTRSHRFDMAGEKAIKFPSLDGFDISMEGTIEWYIDPARVADVFVKYKDERDIITCVVEDILLPNARAFSRIEGSKHLARDFIGGLTREKFQQEFLDGVKRSCADQGILIQSALIRQITPPDAIARPIKDREIAIRLREMYEQQKERERQQRLLSMEEKMKDRKTLMTQAGADVAVATTKANQVREVALIEANRELEVARLQLEAAKNQAEAKVAEGKAQADVVLFKNAAEAAGLKNSAEAFGDGHAYVRYLMNQKLAPAIGYVLSNTDGPFADILKRVLEARAAKPAAPETPKK